MIVDNRRGSNMKASWFRLFINTVHCMADLGMNFSKEVTTNTFRLPSKSLVVNIVIISRKLTLHMHLAFS